MDKVKTISNPLTIVAIFAALAEVAGTTAIALIQDDLQIYFIWFVMGFPILLVSLFFYTLNKNPRVLYAPSDFKDEANFVELIQVGVKTEFKAQQDKLAQKIAIKLVTKQEEINLPLELRRADVTRAEILGRIGMLPMQEKGARFSLKYLNKPSFLQQLNQIREDADVSMLVIQCDSDEFMQFDFEALKQTQDIM